MPVGNGVRLIFRMQTAPNHRRGRLKQVAALGTKSTKAQQTPTHQYR